jgi:hypothetical protein
VASLSKWDLLLEIFIFMVFVTDAKVVSARQCGRACEWIGVLVMVPCRRVGLLVSMIRKWVVCVRVLGLRIRRARRLRHGD